VRDPACRIERLIIVFRRSTTRILVTGGTGTVGSQVVHELTKARHDVQVLARDGSNDADAWEREALKFMPPTLAYDFRYMWEYFQRAGLIATPESIARLTAVLGHAPRGFDGFAAQTAAAWKGAQPPVVSSTS
jgi:nucleoside-diphosphate-sugar epimerase